MVFICPCCCELLKNPIVLQCSHIFCLDCAEIMIDFYRETNTKFYCPECHQSESVFPLNKHWLVSEKKIQKILKNLNKGLGKVNCGLCDTFGEFCCTQCKVFLCAGCKDTHGRGKYKFHAVVVYDTLKKTYCFKHLLPKDLFERSKKVLVCQACSLETSLLCESKENCLNLLESCLKSIQSSIFALNSGRTLFNILNPQQNPLKLLQYFSSIEPNSPHSDPFPDPNQTLYLIDRNTDSYHWFDSNGKKIGFQKLIFFPRWCAVTVLKNGQLLITGGKNDKDNGSKNHAILIDSKTKNYKSGSMLMSHSSHPAVLADDSLVYILGGKDDKNTTGTHCEAFDPTNFTSKPISSMNFGRTCAAGVHFNLNLYVFGGFVSGFTNLIEKFSISSHAWTVLNSTLPVKLFQPGAAVMGNGQVLIFGGEISSDLKNLNSFVFCTRTEKFGLCRKMKVEEQYLGFWYHSLWTGNKVCSVKKKQMISFDLQSTAWSLKRPDEFDTY